MIGRHERRSLPAMPHVVGAHVMDDGKAGPAGEQGTVAELDGQSALGPVQHRLAVEANQSDLGPAA